MEAWQAFIGEGSEKGPKRARNSAVPDEATKLKELMAVLTKLSLKTAQDVRMIIAVTFLCFKVSDEDDLYKAVKIEYKNHAERTRGKTGHNEGGPDGPALVALLFVIMKKHKIGETDTEIITNFLKTFPPQVRQRHRSLCKRQFPVASYRRCTVVAPTSCTSGSPLTPI